MNFIHETVDLGYSDLEADTLPSGRTYFGPTGNKYPSITTVLGILSKEGIEAWKKRVGEEEAAKILHRASERGTAVHDCIEKYLKNDPDHKNYMPNIMQSLHNLKPILDNRIGKVFAQEAALYSDHLGVAGRVDCVAEFDGKISIIDWKTSRKPKRRDWVTNYFIQESFYAIAWEERTGMPIQQLVTVMDVDDNEPAVYIEDRDVWAPELIKTIQLYKESKQML
jgi:genome maintenance exonuclease 1